VGLDKVAYMLPRLQHNWCRVGCKTTQLIGPSLKLNASVNVWRDDVSPALMADEWIDNHVISQGQTHLIGQLVDQPWSIPKIKCGREQGESEQDYVPMP